MAIDTNKPVCQTFKNTNHNFYILPEGKRKLEKRIKPYHLIYVFCIYLYQASIEPVSYTHLDDELINGKDSIPEAYLSKPICNLLLSIANAKSDVFSESIVRKADYLLEKMIMKKPDELFESLIASFGSQYVDNYKDKKLRQGVNLQETTHALINV